MVRFIAAVCIAFTVVGVSAQEENTLDNVTLLKEGVFQERVMNDYRKAATLYAQLLERDKAPSKLRDKARLGLAVCQMRNKDVDLAVKTFAEVFDKSPDLAQAFLAESKLFSDSSSVQSYLKAKKEWKKQSPLLERMRTIVIKKIAFKDTKISVVVDELRKLSKKHDPKGEGINFSLLLTPSPPFGGGPAEFFEEGDEGRLELLENAVSPEERETETKKQKKKREDNPEPTISMDFDNIPVDQAVRYLCEQTGLKYRLDGNLVAISPGFLTQEEFELRFFPVDPDMVRATLDGHEDDDTEVDFKEMFENFGIEFPYSTSGTLASISYDRGTNQLVVRNTAKNLKDMERILKYLNITVPQIVLTETFVEVDVKESVLARVEQGKLSKFILNLPETRLRVLNTRTQRVHSGIEGFISTKGDIQWNGGNGYEQSSLTMTPQIAADNLSISLSLHWNSTIWNSKEDYLKEISLKENDPVVASSNWDGDLRNEITIWDQESACFRIAAAKPHLKRGALFLILKATIVDPAGYPIRYPKHQQANSLGDSAIETGE